MESHIVEARTIARCCYENSFWIQGLIDDGNNFVREMRRDEAASIRSRVEFIFKNAKAALLPVADEDLRRRLRSDKSLDPKPLTPKQASERGPLGKGYLIYSQLSADAAHPSLSALMRYLVKSTEDNHTVYPIEAVPTVRKGEAEQTLEWACGAAVAVIIGVNQLYGGTRANTEIGRLADGQVRLSGYDESNSTS